MMAADYDYIKYPDMRSEAEKLADEHWAYIEQVIRNEYDSETAYPTGSMMDIDAYCRRVGLHYKSAFVHGFKHGCEMIHRGGIL